jgi:hypothetical protein
MVGNASPNQDAAGTVWLVLDDAWEFDGPLSFEVPQRGDALGRGPSTQPILQR